MSSWKQAGIAVSITVALHALALTFSLYFAVLWLDIFMHTLGGFTAALLALAAWESSIARIELLPKTPFTVTLFKYLVILGCVALIGIAWEWYEFGLDFYRSLQGTVHLPTQPSISDTMQDFFFDLLGGTVAFAWHRLTGVNNEQKTVE